MKDSPILASMRGLLNEQYRRVRKLEEENKNLKESLDIATKCSSKEEDGIIRLSEENRKLKEENVRLVKNLAEYKNEITDLKEDKDKLKELLNITVQTKNEYIRNLLDEIEYYKKQCGED